LPLASIGANVVGFDRRKCRWLGSARLPLASIGAIAVGFDPRSARLPLALIRATVIGSVRQEAAWARHKIEIAARGGWKEWIRQIAKERHRMIGFRHPRVPGKAGVMVAIEEGRIGGG
jgi:hypothetical protein